MKIKHIKKISHYEILIELSCGETILMKINSKVCMCDITKEYVLNYLSTLIVDVRPFKDEIDWYSRSTLCQGNLSLEMSTKGSKGQFKIIGDKHSITDKDLIKILLKELI
jgi:hypothetical protein